ncbi:MAG TPA: hypothetical protein VKP13_15980 [Nitrospira sp.]|nr:hypothetical protein [Nitrospira sp.]
MEQEQDIAAYRERLIQSVKDGTRRSTCGQSDAIQVFVNQRRVGLLDVAGTEAALQVQTEARIENVHLRSEDGVLLGGLSAPEYGFRTSRISLLRDAVELRVQNYAQGGSVSAVFIPAQSLWDRTRRALAGMADTSSLRPAAAVVPGMRTMAFTQVLLAIVLVGLAADRLTGWATPEKKPLPVAVTQAEAPWAAPLAEVAKLEHQLVELSRMQAKAVDTIQTQQQGMAQLQRTIAKLSSTQETVASSVLMVKQEMEQRRKVAGREVDRLTRVIMSKAQTEQEQLEAEIHSLAAANDKLSKEMYTLEQSNQDLKKRLKSAGVDVSKATVSDRDKPVVAQQGEAAQPPQVAEARPTPAQSPFLFWVTFSDGTSQESIDQWVRDMHGHKGALTEGWQAVEIQPPAEPMERFLDQIKQTKIVKAVRISR